MTVKSAARHLDRAVPWIAATYAAAMTLIVAVTQCTPAERATLKSDAVQGAEKLAPALEAGHVVCVGLRKAFSSREIATACGLDEGLAAAIRDGLALYDLTRSSDSGLDAR